MDEQPPPKRASFSKEQKRLSAEESTRVVSEFAERERAARDEKTQRLRALRLAQDTGQVTG